MTGAMPQENIQWREAELQNLMCIWCVLMMCVYSSYTTTIFLFTEEHIKLWSFYSAI